MLGKFVTVFFFTVVGVGCTHQPSNNETPSWIEQINSYEQIPFHYYGHGKGASYEESFENAYSIAIEKYASWVGLTFNIFKKSELFLTEQGQQFSSQTKMTGNGQAFSQGLRILKSHSGKENDDEYFTHLVLKIDEQDALDEKQRQKELLKPIVVTAVGTAFIDIIESGGIEIAKIKGQDIATSIATASLALKKNSNGIKVSSSSDVKNGLTNNNLSISAEAEINNVEVLGVEHTVSKNILVTIVKVEGLVFRKK